MTQNEDNAEMGREELTPVAQWTVTHWSTRLGADGDLEAREPFRSMARLSKPISGVGGQGPESVYAPRGPGHFNLFDSVDAAQAEVDPRVGGRLIASATESP
jgi:hypothetical protein